MQFLFPMALATAVLLPIQASMAAETFTPYGTAKADMHSYEGINTVWDVNYADPLSLSNLNGFIRNNWQHTRGKLVVVIHGPELRAFATENYEKYQGVIDPLAELAKQGVEFRMCNNAMRAAGFQQEDIHGFVTIVPAGFAELVHWQSKGYQYVNPNPLPVRDVRYLDQPQLKQK